MVDFSNLNLKNDFGNYLLDKALVLSREVLLQYVFQIDEICKIEKIGWFDLARDIKRYITEYQELTSNKIILEALHFYEMYANENNLSVTLNRRFLIVDLYNGSYHEQKTGHEIFNEIKNPIDNKYYAYIPDYDNPNIEKLGATKNDLFIDDVLIIFVRRISSFNSNRRVIGFYPNARVYKNAIKKEYFNRNFIDKEGTLQTSSYSVESDTYIEVLEDDTFIIETDKYSKWMFRKQRVYPNTYPDLDIKILDFIDNYNKHKVDDDLAIQDSIQYIESATPSIIKKAPYKAIIADNLPSGKSIRRDHTLAKASILKAQYKCELDHTHQTFLNKQQKPYMEGHHFIPLTYNNAKDYWHRFGRNIDCVENIVSLCPNCHRMIHQANDDTKKEILKKLYKIQKVKLESIDIKVALDEIYQLYGV